MRSNFDPVARKRKVLLFSCLDDEVNVVREADVTSHSLHQVVRKDGGFQGFESFCAVVADKKHPNNCGWVSRRSCSALLQTGDKRAWSLCTHGSNELERTRIGAGRT